MRFDKQVMLTSPEPERVLALFSCIGSNFCIILMQSQVQSDIPLSDIYLTYCYFERLI